MHIILVLIKKEFLQIFRNKQMLPVIFGMPVIQLVILVYAATFDVRNINFIVIDNDRSSMTRELIDKIAGSPFYTFIGYSNRYEEAEQLLSMKQADIAIVFGQNTEKSLREQKNSGIQLLINAEDGMMAGIANSYTSSIISTFSNNLMVDLIRINNVKKLNVKERYFYNPELDYKIYMVPGILSILVTMIGLFLAGMNIVKEKEIGTIEQLNVTPIKKYQFISGKLIPFWIIGLFELAFGMMLAYILFGIIVKGSILLMFGLSALYLLVVLAGGLLISTSTDTQQQAMFIAWFFAVLFILMSGLFTPIKSMPQWAQSIAELNPVAHFIEIMRRIIIKGSGISDVFHQIWILSAFAIVTMGLSVWRYKKTV